MGLKYIPQGSDGAQKAEKMSIGQWSQVTNMPNMDVPGNDGSPVAPPGGPNAGKEQLSNVIQNISGLG